MATTEPRPALGVNVFFRVAAGLVLLFVVTIFALIAVLFGDPAAPIAKLLDRIGMELIIGEMCAILIVGSFAMTFDRWRTTQMILSQPQEDADDQPQEYAAGGTGELEFPASHPSDEQGTHAQSGSGNE